MTEDLIVRTTRAGEEVIVSLEGELDLATMDAVRAALTAAVSPTAATVIVDIARLSFMDASGLGLLIAAHRRCADAGCRLTLRHPTGVVERILDIASPTHHLSVERRAPSGRLAADNPTLPTLAGGLRRAEG